MLKTVDKAISFFISYLLALVLLACLMLPMLAIAFCIALFLGRPIIFKQQRSGYQCKIFNIYKFRTLHEAFDEDGQPLPDDERMTRLGQFLRRTSLDELPQLFNVLKGDMVLVGPRPLVPEHVAMYGDEAPRRHLVRPGITGWAQVNGRNALTWGQKFTFDVWYVEHRHLWIDLKILFKTVKCVLHQRGISHERHPGVEKLFGHTPK